MNQDTPNPQGMARRLESQGRHLPLADVSPEAVAANWGKFADMTKARSFDSAGAALVGAFLPG